MNITLRRAGKLRSRVEGRLAEIRSTLTTKTVSLNVHDPLPWSKVVETETVFLKRLVRYETLSNILIDLRRQIGEANEERGVSFMLTRLAALTARKGTVAMIAVSTARLPEDAFKLRFDAALRAAERDTGYGRTDEFVADILSPEVLVDLKREEVKLTKQIDSLTESLEAVNATTTIALAQNVVDVLATEELL